MEMSGALLVTDEKHNIDLFRTGGGPEGASCLAWILGCGFQGRFIWHRCTEKANEMGINDFDKKYNLDEIIRGDSLFCATGITNGDLVDGLATDNKMIVKTLITHKSQNTKKL